MERKLLLRLSSIVFIVGALFGLVISIGGLVVLWANKANVTDQVTGTVSLFGDALSSTHELIRVAGDTLDEAAADTESARKMIIDVAGTLEDSSSMVSSTADLIGNNMVDFVTNTKTSLVSLQNSAKAVDSILRRISSLPLIGSSLGGGYNPDLPLEASVANVSRSLDPLTDSLTKIRRDLDVSSANIATIQAEIEVLGNEIGDIQKSLSDARSVVNQYKTLLDNVQTRYDSFEKRLPVLVNGTYTVITLFLAWIIISQAGILIYGLFLLDQK